MPAVIGVAVVFIVAVAAWVIASRLGDGSTQPAPTIPPPSLVTTAPTASGSTTAVPSTVPDPTVSDATSPVPLPSNVPTQGSGNTTSVAPRPAPTSTVGATTTTGAAVGEGQSGGPGDLGVSGHPIQQPTCEGAFITVVASVVGEDDAARFSVSQQLDAYPDSNYLRTDTSCSSFRQNVDGKPIYVVYLGPFAQPGDACAARPNSNTYVKRLTNDSDDGPGC